MIIKTNFQQITGKFNKLLANTNCRHNTSLLKDTVELTGKKSPKEVILEAVGENYKLYLSSLDLGRPYSTLMLFKRPKMHYIYIDPQKSTKFKTHVAGHISCHYNKSKQLEKFYVYDYRTGSVRMFDKNGNLVKHFALEEYIAMRAYKCSSTNIHKILRGNKNIKNKNIVFEYIKNLSNLFKNQKTWKTEDEMYVYRALDKNSLKKILSMPKDGMIFEDPSFMSVATKKSSTFQFLNLKNFNHIMRIKLPKGTPYLNLDDIGHIIIPQAPENEMVLKNGSKFLIKSRNGMIEAEYIN